MKLRRLSLLTITAASLLLADFTPSAWKFRKRIQLSGTPTLANAVIDNEVWDAALPRLHDLRVVRGAEEVPYVLSQLNAITENKRLDVELINKSVTPGGALEFTLDMQRAAKHNRIEFDISRQNFRSRVRLDSSTDQRTWSTVRREAYVFSYDADSGKIVNFSIQYPDSTRRYLRATIENWPNPDELTGASLHQWSETPAVRAKVGFASNPAGAFDAKTKSTSYTVDLGNKAPKSWIRFETGPGLYHRNLNIEQSDDQKLWSFAGSGALYRTAEEEQLSFSIPETRARYLRFRVYQGDDKPVELKSVTVEGVSRKVTFPINGTGDYWLYYGRADAQPPSYDLPMVLAKSSLDAATPAELQKQEANAGYQPPPEPTKPWTDRNPALLYTFLGAAVLGLGFLTVRFMKQAGPSGPAQD